MGPQSYAVSIGAFILGLRTVGLPVVLACWGKIAGPSWGLVLAADYRIAANTTSFILPIWGPPHCLGDLIGQNAATQLCMANGPTSTLQMLEAGVVHQCQKGQEDARVAAGEMAKRIAGQSATPARFTLSLMSPAVERYALCAARGAFEYGTQGGTGAPATSPLQAMMAPPELRTNWDDLEPGHARVFIDQSAVAHVEMNEIALQESLESAIATLHGAGSKGKPLRAIVLHLEGVPGPSMMHSYALTSGAFMLGLRSVGVPLVLAAWGKIAGPSWALALTCDYRISSGDATFFLPIWNPPECLGDLVGPGVATQLCMSSGPMTPQVLLELGVLQQCVRSKDEVQKSASEMAKRIAGFPGIACRQTMSLLAPAAERFVIAGGRRDGLPPEPHSAVVK